MSKYTIYQEVDFNKVMDIVLRLVQDYVGLDDDDIMSLKEDACKELGIEVING